MVALRARGRVLADHARPPAGTPATTRTTSPRGGGGRARSPRAGQARLYGEARDQERDSSEAQALLDALVNAAPIGQGFLDTDFRYVRVNDALAEINGVPAIDHIGRTVREVLAALADDVEAALEEVVATGEAIVDLQIAGARRGASPAAPAASSRATTRWPSHAASGWASASPSPTSPIAPKQRRPCASSATCTRRCMRAQSELGLAFVLLDGDRIVYANAATEALAGPPAPPSALRAALDPHHAAARRPSPGGRAPRRRARGARAGRAVSHRRSSAPTARACRSRPPGGAWRPTDPRMAVIARASPIASPRSASCKGLQGRAGRAPRERGRARAGAAAGRHERAARALADER